MNILAKEKEHINSIINEYHFANINDNDNVIDNLYTSYVELVKNQLLLGLIRHPSCRVERGLSQVVKRSSQKETEWCFFHSKKRVFRRSQKSSVMEAYRISTHQLLRVSILLFPLVRPLLQKQRVLLKVHNQNRSPYPHSLHSFQQEQILEIQNVQRRRISSPRWSCIM